MTKHELVAEALAQMCNTSGRCFYPAGCPFDKMCDHIGSKDWLEWLNDDGSHCSVATHINDIYARLQKIESKFEDMEDPKSLAAFVKRKIKDVAHRCMKFLKTS